MKNALILHGKSNTSQGNWFPWLKTQLEEKGWLVWSPDLPKSDFPDSNVINNYIFKNKNWQFTKDSYIIGHSSGAVAILGLLQAFSENVVVDTCILVGSFIAHPEDPDWNSVKGLFPKPFDFERIKKHAKRFILIHSDNDPYCLLSDAKYLAENLNGKLIVKKGQGHFNLEMGEAYRQFPFLLQVILS